MDLDDVETVDLNALGGTDTITVNDLSGTDVVGFDGDLAGVLGGTAGDAQPDIVIVNGTNGPDNIDIVGAGTSASVLGLPTEVNITNSEGANDSLVVNALGGDDAVTATSLPAGVIELTIDGGAGADQLLGSQGADAFLGGDDDDDIFGDNGNDLALMGGGDDVFRWDPGDGNDTIEGQDGTDSMLFVGANTSEDIDIAANGGRVRFFRNVANVTMDLDDVETIDFRALGGADNVVVGDLSGTDLTQNSIDLGGPNGGGDGQADTVTVNGTNGADVFGAAGGSGGVDVSGLSADVSILSPEQANDRLTLNSLGGDDTVDASALAGDGIQLTMNGGLGDDVSVGSEGDDLINGGDGNDVALMGAGDDTFVWNPGDDNDTLEGQAGSDTMLFNGANAAENIDIAANGGRVLFFRNVANVTMDLNDVEAIDFEALGGADTIVVNDLCGTDVNQVDANLATGGGGDGQPDTVVVNATNGDDVVVVAGDAAGTSVLGLSAQVNMTGAEAANDRLTVNALAGDDVVEASGLAAGAIQLTADGGQGDDVLIGGDGNDVLAGRPRRRRAPRWRRHRRHRRRRRRRHRDPARRPSRTESARRGERRPGGLGHACRCRVAAQPRAHRQWPDRDHHRRQGVLAEQHGPVPARRCRSGRGELRTADVVRAGDVGSSRPPARRLHLAGCRRQRPAGRRARRVSQAFSFGSSMPAVLSSARTSPTTVAASSSRHRFRVRSRSRSCSRPATCRRSSMSGRTMPSTLMPTRPRSWSVRPRRRSASTVGDATGVEDDFDIGLVAPPEAPPAPETTVVPTTTAAPAVETPTTTQPTTTAVPTTVPPPTTTAVPTTVPPPPTTAVPTTVPA